jgi:RNA-directed DNA polymerase
MRTLFATLLLGALLGFAAFGVNAAEFDFYRRFASLTQTNRFGPDLTNATLSLTMEEAIRSRIRKRHDQVNFIRYADDFIVTARTKETLEQIVKPAVVAFLAQRGLELSEQKTIITHIAKGFNFLGQKVRKYRNKLLIKPAKEGLKALLQKTREGIKGCLGQTAETLITKLNPITRGWANYHRHVCSAKTFWNADRAVHYQLLRWAKRTHPNKPYRWLKQKYFSHEGQFGFFARKRTSAGETKVLRLHTPRRTVLERHVKVRGEANPYDPNYTEYFERRRCFAWRTVPLQKDWSTRPRRCIKGSGCSR